LNCTVTSCMFSCSFYVIQVMRTEVLPIEHYLRDTLGITITTTPWRGRNHLPHFLKEQYSFVETTLLGKQCLFVIDTGSIEQSPAALRKHMDMIQARQEGEVIYVRSAVTAYNRKRLIEHKVPFIVPGNQMYLPMLAIDLREYFRTLRSEVPTLSPSTQAIIIDALLRKTEVITPSGMAQRLGYSAMTMTRAFNELATAKLADVTVESRQRHLRFNQNGRELWTKALPLLRSPVNKRLFIRRSHAPTGGLRAGLTALAQYSMLASPEYTTHALSQEDWKSLKQVNKLIVSPIRDADVDELEVWSYPPALFAEHNKVDPLSLYLSLKDQRDERVEASVEEMMKNVAW
jgi:hypothetical protein